MQSVPAPHLVGGAARARRRLLRPAALIGLLAALATGGAVALALTAADAPAPAPSRPYAGLIAGVPLQSARCEQWNGGSAAERDRVVGALAFSVGGATPYGRGNTLTASQAHALFARACSSPIAQHWLLYELYIRAAGFGSYVPR